MLVVAKLKHSERKTAPSIMTTATTTKLSGTSVVNKIYKNAEGYFKKRHKEMPSYTIFMDVPIYDHKDVKSYKLINKCNPIFRIPTKFFMTLYKKMQR